MCLFKPNKRHTTVHRCISKIINPRNTKPIFKIITTSGLNDCHDDLISEFNFQNFGKFATDNNIMLIRLFKKDTFRNCIINLG